VDFLAIGAVLALAAHRDGGRGRLQDALTRVFLPIGLAVYALLFWLNHGIDHHAPLALEDTGAALVFCWLINSASRGFGGAVGALLEWRPIVYLGKISYGIYIFHFLVPLAFAPIARHLNVAYEDAGFLNFVATSLATFAIAALSWELFERPINGLKRYFPYESASVGSPAAQAVSPS
jgi:peptidoglycan/LPS O-acetylase OafA/YrhL